MPILWLIKKGLDIISLKERLKPKEDNYKVPIHN